MATYDSTFISLSSFICQLLFYLPVCWISKQVPLFRAMHYVYLNQFAGFQNKFRYLGAIRVPQSGRVFLCRRFVSRVPRGQVGGNKAWGGCLIARIARLSAGDSGKGSFRMDDGHHIRQNALINFVYCPPRYTTFMGRDDKSEDFGNGRGVGG
ncbi:hypothetical protein CEXT_743341 [Caerostris extrusa]|uniref:Uncharacterized protein n=1 Tax=Caerostris extrusa TaxID=172846 RepID=A0AAV4VU76_CAEEX|nr:hypothetical protein CEXT_743341 [Caerostris extrusa]